MKIRIQQFRQGRSDLTFEITKDELRDYLSELSGTYEALGNSASFEGEVDRFNDTLQIKGELVLSYVLTCSRCVAEQERSERLPVRWTLLPKRTLDTRRLRDDEEVELSTDDLDVSFYEGDEIDLGELVREALLLELDPADECGEEACDDRLTTLLAAKADEVPDAVDPRWAGLAALKANIKK